MKLCYLADSGSIHTQRWVKHFVERGDEVHLISLTFANLPDVNLHYIKTINIPNRAIWYLINLLPILIQVKLKILKIKPEILHAHYAADYGIIGFLMDFHPFIISVWGSDVLRTPKKWKYWGQGISFSLKNADIILTIPEFMKEYLISTFNLPENKIVRIPWGIDLKIFHRGYENETKMMKEKLGIKEKSPIVLSNRGMAPEYKIETIVEAIPYALKTFPDMIFIFIKGYGSSKFEDEIKSKAENLNIISSIRFISKHLSPEEMAIYLNMADVFISIPKTDQFASSIMEGMACGVIPIVSNLKVYEQYLKNGINAFVVDPDNPKEISEKIKYGIKNIDVKNKFNDINKKIIEENEDWNNNSKKMEEFYDNLLKGGI